MALSPHPRAEKIARLLIGLLVLAPSSRAEPPDGSDDGFDFSAGDTDSGFDASIDSDGPITVTIEVDNPVPNDAQTDDGDSGDGGGTDANPPDSDPPPTPDPPPPPPPAPSASLSASPAAGTTPLAAMLSWSTSDASSAVVAGNGLASSDLAGAQSVTLDSPGTYTYTITASGPGGQVTQSATVTASAPLFSLTTYVIGDGTVTPGGTYPADTEISVAASPAGGSRFAGWTGSISGDNDPLSVTMTGDIVLYANFVPLLAQTISFSPPGSVKYPGSPVSLAATATSGLPVSFSLVSGPATLAGNQLTPNGAGAIVVLATQSGDSVWLPAPPVSGTLNASPAVRISRIRFNATGTDSRTVNRNAIVGSSFIWTDPDGLQDSPWPTFGSPQSAAISSQNTPLPAAPSASP